MAIKLIKIESETPDRKVCVLFADDKQEVPQTGAATLPGVDLGVGSVIYSADGEIGFLKSDDTWNWVE